MAEEIKKSNQPEENQTEPEKAGNVDNCLPYEPPLLRKHGKINDETKIIVRPGFRDGPLGFRFSDLS